MFVLLLRVFVITHVRTWIPDIFNTETGGVGETIKRSGRYYVCVTMHPAIKIAAGSLMIVAGVYGSVTFLQDLIQLGKAAIGPLLVLVGSFIVWLESDEWKRMASKTEDTQVSETAVDHDTGPTQPAHTQILEGTVDEVRSEVMERDDIDIEALLEAEREGKERKTLIDFLERRV